MARVQPGGKRHYQSTPGKKGREYTRGSSVHPWASTPVHSLGQYTQGSSVHSQPWSVHPSAHRIEYTHGRMPIIIRKYFISRYSLDNILINVIRSITYYRHDGITCHTSTVNQSFSLLSVFFILSFFSRKCLRFYG